MRESTVAAIKALAEENGLACARLSVALLSLEDKMQEIETFELSWEYVNSSNLVPNLKIKFKR